MRALENRVPPPLVAFVVAAAMATAAWLAPPSPVPWQARAAGAAVLFAAAAACGGGAVLAFRRAGTTVDPVHIERASALVTTGVYSRTRNPMYVGVALLLAAWAVWLGRLAPSLGPVAFVAFIGRFQIVPEERALEARFGAQYSAYRDRVPRWLL